MDESKLVVWPGRVEQLLTWLQEKARSNEWHWVTGVSGRLAAGLSGRAQLCKLCGRHGSGIRPISFILHPKTCIALRRSLLYPYVASGSSTFPFQAQQYFTAHKGPVWGSTGLHWSGSTPVLCLCLQ
mmetsp:Transcript_21403/g.33945  ORF Transcript_21403/g.33945 Transcript_21403/m.33945 type:complete len:127 (+) Transcript_21403:726-1106(+)